MHELPARGAHLVGRSAETLGRTHIRARHREGSAVLALRPARGLRAACVQVLSDSRPPHVIADDPGGGFLLGPNYPCVDPPLSPAAQAAKARGWAWWEALRSPIQQPLAQLTGDLLLLRKRAFDALAHDALTNVEV